MQERDDHVRIFAARKMTLAILAVKIQHPVHKVCRRLTKYIHSKVKDSFGLSFEILLLPKLLKLYFLPLENKGNNKAFQAEMQIPPG